MCQQNSMTKQGQCWFSVGKNLKGEKRLLMVNSSYSITDPIERIKAWIKEQEKAERCLALRGSKTSLNWPKSPRNSIALSYDTSGTKSVMGARHDAKTLYTIIDYVKNLEGEKGQEYQSKGNNLTNSQVKTTIDLLFQ